MLKLNLKELLKRALMVNAQEVRLVPGRRTIVITSQGENEVRGDAQTPEKINAMLDPVMSPEGRRALASGRAQWLFELEEHGQVGVIAELKMGLIHASFDLSGSPQEPDFRSTKARKKNSPTMTSLEQTAAKTSPKIEGAVVPTNTTQPSMRKPDTSPPRDAIPIAPGSPRVTVSMGSIEKINRLLKLMSDSGASDLHISVSAPPMLRLDGDMIAIQGEPALSADDVEQLIAPMIPARNLAEFKETHDTDFAHEITGLARFRSNVFVDLNGWGAVFRVIPTKILTTEQLGLPKELLSLCNLSKGLVVVTGPTGSGKSTTLAALIDYINRHQKKHIITIEDPVEFVHPNKLSLINQREVKVHTDSFKKALRAALREDPDIILLGEMRDLETIAIAMETAETGHLVFGTLHTSSAPSTIDRIIDQFPTDQQNQVRTMLSTSLKGVISQMLCKKRGGGRAAALEVMIGVPAVANLIREGKIFQIPSIMQTSRKIGMTTMNDSLITLVKAGTVEADEALSKSNDKSGLQTQLRKHNISFSETA